MINRSNISALIDNMSMLMCTALALFTARSEMTMDVNDCLTAVCVVLYTVLLKWQFIHQ